MKITRLILIILVFLLLSTQNYYPAAGKLPPERHVNSMQLTDNDSHVRRVNIPYFSESILWARTAIFWFGINEQGLPGKNYVDIRMGYTDSALEIQATVMDYFLWFDPAATPVTDLTQFDAIAVYLDTNLDQGMTPQSDDYQFLLGSNRFFQDNENYKRETQGNGSGWNHDWNGTWSGLSYMSWACNPGPNYNDCGRDFGWTAIYSIPWETLGLAGPPADETVWGLGMQLYDRDDNPPAGSVAPEYWPETFQSDSPATWGEIHFGPARFRPETEIRAGSTTIRASSPTDNSAEDAWMGGGGLCAGGQEGGSEVNHGDDTSLFTGSETAATNFPCFNKSYLRFQLDDIPQGVEIISASLTLHLYGNADQSIAPPYSWTHLFTINDDWDELTIHWNNAPLAQENIAVIQVYPYSQPTVVWPGDPYAWDASKAVAEAFAAGQPVNLALYSSDTGRDTSKYFSSSETGDWNTQARPTLKVFWGHSLSHIDKFGSQSNATRNDVINYTITWEGNNEAQTMVDQLPAGLSEPSHLQVNLGSASYAANSRQIQWSGNPALGQVVTLTYQVQVQTNGPVVLANTSSLSSNNNTLSSDTFNLFIDSFRVYLPQIAR